MRLAVIIATLGRAPIVSRLMEQLAAQSRPPDRTVVSVVTEADGPARAPTSLGVEVILSKKGLCAQRNRGLDHVGAEAEIVTFLDDDFVPAPDYLEHVEKLLANDTSLAGVTGAVIADGVTGPGIDYDEALRILAQRTRPEAPARRRRTSLYGCNMSFRTHAARGLRFDERLPLYGWLEDVDYSATVGRNGALIHSDLIAGVHLGVKAGRTSGVRFGYSQIVNPIYLFRKGTVPFTQSASNIVRNLTANHLRALAPEPYVDRRGRVKGNWLAIGDVMRGKVSPEHILDL